MTELQSRPSAYVDRILESLQAGGDRPALINGDRRLSRAGAGGMILRLAAALRSRGLRKGDSVALLSGNNPDGVLVGLAVHLIGCRLVCALDRLRCTALGKPDKKALLRMIQNS